MSPSQWTRRDMLKAGAAAGAAAITLPALIPARALGRDGAAPASETVRVGIIGCGGRSRDALSAGSYTKAYHVVSVCDCQIARAQGLSKERSKGQWPVYDDFRKMIDKEKLDAVMIETTTHARAWIVIQAMQAGVDTYIEKPMCLTIAEGRAMVNAARKFKTVTQVGTQQRSIPLNNFASDLVKNGAIGKILTVVAPNFVGPEFWTKSSSADVKGAVDPWWDIWTNQAELRPSARTSTPAGPAGSTMTAAASASASPAGRPFLRPDQPRLGHRRHRPGRGRS